ncbi:MAG: Gfo/Idh/MocA family oxidoreductase [Clostridia bacterium]|nr:Gfo/Idh/MocA family oxidoreductase [Clostridia bacterium]
MKTLRIGVVGVGNIGSAHVANLYRGEIPGMTLVALCDTDEDKRQYLRNEYPDIPVFDDHATMMASGLLDGVIIATPHRFHPPIAEDSFRAGLHVLSEKPAGVDCGTVRRLHETAKASGKVYGIMFNQRTDPLFIKARVLVKSGRIGEPKRLVWIITNWYRTQAYYDSGSWRATWDGEGGGVLLNQAPHNLDLWQWIFGMPKRIRAFCYNGKYHNISVEDDATIYAEYENGATATFITTTGEYPGTNRLEIAGDRGKIVIERGKLTFYELSESERDYCFHGKDRPHPTVTVSEYEAKEALSGHKQILKNFAAHILNSEELIAPGYDGIHELMLSNAAYLSSWTNDWVELPFDEDRFASMLDTLAKNAVKKTAIKEDELRQEGYRDRWQVQW